jgi:threonine/homoserine/homoserine lactone efflux protein
LDRPTWHAVLGGAGVLVLGYLGVDALRAGADPPTPEDATRAGRPFLVGFSIGIANPITLLWFLTVGGGLIAAHGGGGTARSAIAFGASFIIGVVCWDTVVAGLAGYGRRWMGPKTLRALNVTAGLVFFAFALRLGWKLAQMLR